MNGRLSKKLIGVNILIIAIALVVMTLITSLTVTRYVKNGIEQQLESENNMVTRLYMLSRRSDTDEAGALFEGSRRLYNNLAESTTVIYSKNSETDRYNIVFSSNDQMKVNPQMVALLDTVSPDIQGEFFEFQINLQQYIGKVSGYRSNPNNEDISVVTLSFIPSSELREINARILLSIILAAVIVGAAAVVVTLLFSRRLTKPLGRLRDVTRKYADRQFDEKADAHAIGEIGDVAQSVNEMAQSLQAYNENQHRFFRTVSHELKTPLTAIQGYAEGLQAGIFEDEDEKLNIIIEESKRLGALVTNLVYLDKLESGIDPYTLAPHSMNECVVGAIKKVESIAILSDIELNYQPGEDATAMIDPGKMTRAFINLLSNCIKYAKSAVWICAQRTGDQYVFECIDDGDGFEPHVLQNLFDKAIVGKKEGSGLGLSIAREIAQKHGGTISAHNHETHGAVLRIALPVVP